MIYIYEGILSSGVSLVQLGEEQFGQEGINFGFTLDGTKDSAKFEVLSFRRESVKPFSVVCHHETSSWWIVQKDKVERYTNEQGWVYKHSLQCIGAIELLNARDLTNCGFNQGKYTLREFILRLFQLSNFEFKTPTLTNNDNIDLDQVVDYIKTFENYTLLSALRELLDGYNQCVKLNFTRNLTYNQITGCELVITPKTGDISLQVLDIDTDFNNVQEQRNMDKNSYGTIVVSNVDNAVSSETKIYPNVGGAKLMSTEYTTTPENATIKLPSNVFYVDEVIMYMTLRLAVRQYYSGDWHYTYEDYGGYFNVANLFDSVIEKVITSLKANFGQFSETDFRSNLPSVKEKIRLCGSVKFRQGVVYNPDVNNPSYSFKDDSYAIKVLKLKSAGSAYVNASIVLMDEETAKGTHNPWNCIKWKRGSDEINGFGWLAYDLATTNAGTTCRVPLTQTEYGQDNNILYEFEQAGITTQLIIASSETTSNYYLTCDNFSHNNTDRKETLFKVKYIPMTDLKVVLDNNEENKHTHLYNQNGKLTDTLAFSKLINSYKIEIESENVVKYYSAYELFTLGTSTFRNIECPKLGQIVLDSNNEQYIINSVSYNLYQSEPNEYIEDNTTYAQYYIECEYSLSKNVATKSLMVNPNTNIRDYGIPQKYNVRRTHLYRDFWEIDHSDTPHLDLPHQTLSKVLNISNYPQEYAQHTALIRIHYSHLLKTDGIPQDTYYYQLESTTFMLKKSIFEVVEFKDNNIIGYDCQNITSGFDITKMIEGLFYLKNTPISYVDENGEFDDIGILMCNTEQMENIYDTYRQYLETITPPVTTDLPLQDMMIFIPSEVYTIATLLSNHDYDMGYNDYFKDALEVPVFEYACQLDDTSDIIIGENVLVNSEQDSYYIYSYVLTQKGVANNNNWTALTLPIIQMSLNSLNQIVVSSTDIVKMTYNSNKLDVELYGGIFINTETGNVLETTKQDLSTISNYDIAIIRRTIRYATTNARLEETITTGHIDPQDFVQMEYDYQYSQDISIDTTNINANSVRIVRIRKSTNIPNLQVTATYDSANSRFSVVVNSLTQPDASAYLDVYIDYSYETSTGSYSNTNNDLMFVIRHTENANIENDTMSLSLNSWRLD